ncbi:hypothetical protein M7I_2060 [Glarea lozoyensis 74030]|uniref:Uncharacterized protein n=1 Tax=Glarea lozoyensis (strain ATCC 74030 / MF5533) TaxID=1104152 RepID=H0EHS4_GLAL7|nr:hypothetical protein M7I_2060 [Glarea lozoyensis 74030]
MSTAYDLVILDDTCLKAQEACNRLVTHMYTFLYKV